MRLSLALGRVSQTRRADPEAKMEELDWDDERPIEEYPGYVGMTMDYDFRPEEELRNL